MKENVRSRDETRRSLKNHQGEKSIYNFCCSMYIINNLSIDQSSGGVTSTVAAEAVVRVIVGIMMPVDDVCENTKLKQNLKCVIS